MTRIPRKTLFLALLLILAVIGVIVSAFHRPSNPNDAIDTHAVHTIVATMDGALQRVGTVPASPTGSVTQRGWPAVAWLLGLGLIALWIVRTREPGRQQHSRNKRS